MPSTVPDPSHPHHRDLARDLFSKEQTTSPPDGITTVNGQISRTSEFLAMRPTVLFLVLIFVTCSGLHVGTYPDAETFRVMAFNIHHAADASGTVDVERIARVIRESGADVVALQEVDRGVDRSGRLDLVFELSEATGLPYFAFGKNIDFGGGAYGNALISRFPIVDHENVLLEQLETHEQRGVLSTVLDVDGSELHVFVIHFDHANETERIHSVRQVEQLLTPGPAPYVIAGDLNDIPESDTYRMMTDLVNDAWLAAGDGPGYTFPSDSPDRRIDYIFHTSGVHVSDAWVPESQASDHRPVVVEVSLR